MDQIGKIVDIQGAIATVELERSSACAKCGICHSGETQTLHIEVENSIDAKVGQRVLIAVSEGSVLKASLILYLIPLLALVGGIGAPIVLNRLWGLPSHAEWWGIGLGFLLFISAYAAIRRREPDLSRNPAFNPRMIRIAGDHEEIPDLCETIDE